MTRFVLKRMTLLFAAALLMQFTNAQTSFERKFKRSEIYSGIEVGSKGVKMSIIEVGKNAQSQGTFNTLKDTSINTDFISFTAANFNATLNALTDLFNQSKNQYNIAPDKIFTAVSSGVMIQAEKELQLPMVKAFADSFKIRIGEPQREVPLIDVMEEARLSHLGIVPAEKRYSTFLIDIGSGNTKGGYFPYGNTNELKLFQLSWGTKSVVNGTDKRTAGDESLDNFKKQLFRVIEGPANTEIVYAVNVSGAYNMSDNIAFSGGIAWATASLMYPELMDNPVVPVTYAAVEKFAEKLYADYASVSEGAIVQSLTGEGLDKSAIGKQVKTVNKVFDQKAMMGGISLLLKIMRQFEGVYDQKQFYLVKNGQVGWISAYVDQHISK